MRKSRMFRAAPAAPRFAAILVLALAACEEARGVSVQPLPPLQRPSPEARAGLPEVAGTWRFAGWELPVRDTVTGGEGMVPPGALGIRTQRLDSIAGVYVRDGQPFPVIGEVRRDGIVSVVAFGPDGSGSFIAGRVLRDTLWIELTSLSAAQTWSTGARAALVRTAVRQPFVRYQGGFVKVNVDSIRADSVRRDSLRVADSLRLADSALAGAVPGQPGAVPGQVVPGQPGVRPGAPPAAAPGQPQPGARPGAPPAGTQPQPRPQQQTPRAQPKQQTTEAQRRRAQEAERRRREEAERRREEEQSGERQQEEEPEPRERPSRPDTARRPPQPVIIP